MAWFRSVVQQTLTRGTLDETAARHQRRPPELVAQPRVRTEGQSGFNYSCNQAKYHSRTFRQADNPTVVRGPFYHAPFADCSKHSQMRCRTARCAMRTRRKDQRRTPLLHPLINRRPFIPASWHPSNQPARKVLTRLINIASAGLGLSSPTFAGGKAVVGVI